MQPKIVLDGFVLLETRRVEDPEEAQKAVLEGCGISAVVTDDLLFRKLTHLDLGDNHVQLESLAYLPALRARHPPQRPHDRQHPGRLPEPDVLNLSLNA